MIGIVTVSDTRTANSDESGPAIEGALQGRGFGAFTCRIVKDDVEAIQGVLTELSEKCDVVFTTGGTGFTARDVTPEATLPLLDRQAQSLAELIRLRGLEQTALSHLSRGVAGVRGACLIVNLPGSPAGARQGAEVLAPLLTHIIAQLRGDMVH